MLFSRCLPPRGPLRMLRQAPICCRDLQHFAFRLGIGHLLGLNLRLLREVQPMVHIAFLGRHMSLFFPKIPCTPPSPNALSRPKFLAIETETALGAGPVRRSKRCLDSRA